MLINRFPREYILGALVEVVGYEPITYATKDHTYSDYLVQISQAD